MKKFKFATVGSSLEKRDLADLVSSDHIIIEVERINVPDIGTLKTQISMLKSTEDKAGARELQQQFDHTKKQLDDLHAARKEASKETDAALETPRRARAAHDEAWQDLRQYKDAFYNAKKEFHNSERELNKARDAKRRAEREAYARSKRQEALERDWKRHRG